jgi:hypothetical protein
MLKIFSYSITVYIVGVTGELPLDVETDGHRRTMYFAESCRPALKAYSAAKARLDATLNAAVAEVQQ